MRVSRPVRIGDVTIGGGADPVVQSMTSTPTHEVERTWDQIQRLARGGARLVRVAVPDRRAASALPRLVALRQEAGERIPLVADIHFSATLAFEALAWVEKVRVNPGNLLEPARGAGTARGGKVRAQEVLRQLFREARGRGKAVRVGVNQGSLSRRIVASRGTGPDAMVESALEYVRVAEEEGFGDVVISLKSSNPWEVVAANLALARRCDYPLHVGVTEAGFGLQGRARSAVGVGLLIRHGIADTIRVSLAEPPERELPMAFALVKARRNLLLPGTTGGSCSVQGVQVTSPSPLRMPFVRSRVRELAVVVAGDGTAVPITDWDGHGPLPRARGIVRVAANPSSPGDLADMLERVLVYGLSDEVVELQLPLPGPAPGGHEHLTDTLGRIHVPLTWEARVSGEDDLACVTVDLAQLLEARLVSRVELAGLGTPVEDREAALDILQGLGAGEWRASIIACPQCGRCRIDVPALAAEVRRRMGDRPGLTIGVMGCIVNGPGELASAAIGCVGEGEGSVALYRHGSLVARGVPVHVAVDRLLELTDEVASEC